MLVEEVPKSTNAKSSTIYFTSSINLSARSSHFRNGGDDEEATANKKGRAKVNYNVNQLMNAQTQSNGSQPTDGPLKSAQQIQLERIVSKRLNDLNKESNSFEIPKNFSYNPINSTADHNKKSRLGNTPSTKKILSARRNLNSYFEEERNLMSINTVLSLNYQFVDFSEVETIRHKMRKTERNRTFRPRVRLCCICGTNSNYSRCHLCGLFYCSVRCNKYHQESRCK
ncbi:hypothetical protein DFJ63DRAFT_312700 [Scheffersomyces coipomensis]|uniref:uncharacterized protein n=1 Tax=Scheffersomyces coipomensis TaxID=1788519 RepID=UPI00315D4B62